MPGPLDALVRSLGANLTRQFGKRVTYTRVVPGEYDPATRRAATTKSTKTLSVLMGDPSKLQRFGFGETGSVQTGDLVLDVPAAAFEVAFGAGTTPSNADSVTLDGQSYGVEQAKPQWANEQVHTWTLQMRR